MISSKLRLALLFSIFCVSARACDLCGCYNRPLDSTASEPAQPKSFSIYAGVGEQFTSFGTERLNGEKAGNPAGEYLNSSISQVVVGASFFDNRFWLQTNIPLIYRAFRRSEGFEIEHGSVSGLGDISVSANLVVFRKEALFHEESGGLSKDSKAVTPLKGEPDFTALVNLSAGLKLPTGDSGELGAPEVDVEGAPESGIGGHDLTLGTGSVDGIFGIQTFVRYKALFLQADAQFGWRGRGAYSYRFANDLSWSGGPGVYLLRKSDRTLGVQCVLSGETKGYDKQLGQPQFDTGVNSLYVGPRIIGSFGRFSGDIAIDLPVIMNTTAFQITPDYRIRAGLTYRF